MKIALSQINTATGDLAFNTQKMVETIAQAQNEGIDLLVFPELSLPGYPPKDFIFTSDWFTQQEKKIQELRTSSAGIHVILGVIHNHENKIYNAAMWIDRDGKITLQKKRLLPNQDVFDEKRYFSSGDTQSVWQIEQERIGISICEDLWAPFFPQYTFDPIAELAQQKPTLMINISASPFVAGKDKVRKDLVQTHQKSYPCPFLYLNLVGGNDELIFDGGSFAMAADGRLLMQIKSFEEDVLLYDTGREALDIAAYPEDVLEQKKHAIVLGLQDFVHKSGFKKVVLGLSGGIDSAVVAGLAVEALGAENVITVFMPTEYTRDISRVDAKHIAQSLGTRWYELPMDEVKNQLQANIATMLERTMQSLTFENMQARIRGVILMAVSSEENALVLQTGNKSEMALGYCTLYGDMVGAISPIADLYKHEVYGIGKLLNQDTEVIPTRVFERAPSAELKADQEDTDSLPPYDVVDPIVRMCVEEGKSVEEAAAAGYDLAIVQKLYGWIE
ncbi:MAG: NAD+ synthase, partial [Deltaproteobacteria bacterium]|nr:NAD+ synthase [Deltaproteobacteria bacterium]